MKKITSCLLLLCFFAISNLSAQKAMLSISGNAGFVSPEGDLFHHYKPWGAALGAEIPFMNNWSYGLDVDWQFIGSDVLIAYSIPQDPFFEPIAGPVYTLYQHQFNIRPGVRYYFKKAFTGFYVGAFGAYSYLTVKTRNYPQDPIYTPDVYADPSDDFGLGGGITYGYRLRLIKSLQASLFLSHQYLRMQNSSVQKDQYDHQLGLGLNWVF